jgi:site-specific DNA-methyltransferase (adenine-specific)
MTSLSAFFGRPTITGPLLLHGDCLEKMKNLPSKSIDCFICDLPYGCLSSKTMEFKHECPTSVKRISGCSWDVKIDLVAFWEQVKRLARDDHTPVLMFCTTKFGVELINSNPTWFRYDIVWDKGCGVSFLSANKMPMRSHENIYVFAKKGAYYKRVDEKGEFPKSHSKGNQEFVRVNTYNGGQPLRNTPSADNSTSRCVLSVVDIHTERQRGKHPTQKPKDLYRWLLERYCPPGGTMLDPTAGSFNSIFTAKEMGIHAIGIEKDDTFFWKAVQTASP